MRLPLAGLLALAAAGACTPELRRGDTLVVGVSLLTKAHPFYESLEGGLRRAAGDAGIELKVQSAEFDNATQTAQLENFVMEQVDAIILSPVDSEAIGGAIGRANAARIPVFTADIRAVEGTIVCHVASDNRQGGALVAADLARALGGKGNVAVLDQPGVGSVAERVEGFQAALARFPDLHIVAKLSGGGVRDQAATTTENLLQAHPDLKAIFAINDSSALGAVSVLEAHGRRDVLVFGFDGDPEGREAIRRGAMVADAVQDPGRIGLVTVQTLVKSLRGEQVPAEIRIETSLLDRATLEREQP